MSITVFDFDSCSMATAGTHERPLFDAAPVCTYLGLADVSKACERLEQDEVELVAVPAKNSHERTIAQRSYRRLFVTESGLYALIFTSRKPEAKAFRKWVTSEVLPAIRRKGYYSAIEAEQEKLTEKLLAECFPNLPGKAEPIFRGLIAALVKIRRERENGNPPWARNLARMIYAWAIPIDGEQSLRRSLNAHPNGSSVDYSMLSDRAKEVVLQTINTATAFARISANWEDWKVKMEIAFGKKSIQLPFLVPMAQLPAKELLA